MESNVNISPAISMVNLFLNEINRDDTHELFNVQRSVLEQLDNTNERLNGLNQLSAMRYVEATKQFEQHTHLLTTMKTDLDTIFKRIKVLKSQLSQKYPDAYMSVLQQNSHRSDACEDDDDDDEGEDYVGNTLKPLTSSSLVKSKTVLGPPLASSMRETLSLTQLNQSNSVESSPRPFNAVRRFVFENSSSPGQELAGLLKNARDEWRKLNEGLLGTQHSKSNTTNKE